MIALFGTVWAILRGNVMLQIATAIVVGWLGLKANNLYQRHVGGKQVVAEINKQAGVLSEKATEAREPARRPGAVERLRAQHCRDC